MEEDDITRQMEVEFGDGDEENNDLGEGADSDEDLEDKLDDGIEENLSALKMDEDDIADGSFDCD